jgi:endonuclease YncB( thermonuclease family)
MRAAVPAILSVTFVLIGLGVFVGGRHAARQVDAPAESVAGTGLPPAPPADPENRPPATQGASRQIAPDVVAPPELDTGKLEWAAPRPPLSDLSVPLPPKQEEKGGMLFRPLAVESAVVEAKGVTVTIAGTVSLPPDETCEIGGQTWACGMRARTAFRMWLRGRALDCDLPPEAGGDVTAACRLGKQDAGAWLVANGWARAAPGGSYAEAEAAARTARKGIFGPPPDLTEPTAESAATASAAASGTTPPADRPARGR